MCSVDSFYILLLLFLSLLLLIYYDYFYYYLSYFIYIIFLARFFLLSLFSILLTAMPRRKVSRPAVVPASEPSVSVQVPSASVDDDPVVVGLEDEDDLLKRRLLGMKLPMKCSMKLVKLIKLRKYVSFAEILDEKSDTKTPLSFDEWVTAWNVFCSIHLIYFPDDGPLLPHHFEYIRDAAKKSPNWEEYDKVFRFRIANFPEEFKWNVKDQETWNDVVLSDVPSRAPALSVSVAGPSRPPAKKFKVGVVAGPDSKFSTDPYMKGLCRNFNTSSCAYGDACKFRHQCGLCFPEKELKHSAKFCPFVRRP